MFSKNKHVSFNTCILFKAGQTEAIKSVVWANGEPLKGKECSVLKTSLWHPDMCQSKEYFVCIGKKIFKQKTHLKEYLSPAQSSFKQITTIKVLKNSVILLKGLMRTVSQQTSC